MFTGNEGTMITEEDAQTLVDTYRDSYPGKVKGIFFGKNQIDTLLNQTGAKGIRIYLGEENDDFKMVIVAADSSENDILNKILDIGKPCPECCTSTGSLR